jgi:hypothetical protein
MNRIQKERQVTNLKFRIMNLEKALLAAYISESIILKAQLNKLKQELKDLQQSLK